MTDPVHLFEELRAVKSRLKEMEAGIAQGMKYTCTCRLDELWRTGIALTFTTDEFVAALKRRQQELVEQLKGMRQGILELAKEIADGVEGE